MPASISMGGACIRKELEALSPARIDQAGSGLRELIRLTQAWALRGCSVVTALVPSLTRMPAWTHWPDGDAIDAGAGYRWFYHCHAGGGRIAGEHGHFHVFSGRGDDVAHLLALSVDAKGLPIALFAPNGWVTGSRWLGARTVLSHLQRFHMRAPRRCATVSRWLAATLQAFAPQVRAVVRRRDERLDVLRGRHRRAILEDRRIAILSRCRLDLAVQAHVLDDLLPPHPLTRRP